MEDNYYVITSGEDGIDILKFRNVSQLEDWIDKNFNPDETEERATFLNEIPDISKGHFYFREYEEREEKSGGMVIIKGKIIVPEAVEVVKKYKFESD